MWRDILAAFVKILVPLLFAALLEKYPDVPLTGETVLALVLYILAKLGWIASAMIAFNANLSIRAKYNLK